MLAEDRLCLVLRSAFTQLGASYASILRSELLALLASVGLNVIEAVAVRTTPVSIVRPARTEIMWTRSRSRPGFHIEALLCSDCANSPIDPFQPSSFTALDSTEAGAFAHFVGIFGEVVGHAI